ncbi:MAG: glycosyltransferase family 1 protein, partial [Bryobacteraceae bacterium]
RAPDTDMRPLAIGVNALYLLPGGVGGTEIYLRGLLGGLAEIDPVNRYVLFTNRETGPDLAPARPNFRVVQQAVRAVSRPRRILWEQSLLPLEATRRRLDVMFNPGFTAPLLAPCPQVTMFHDLQHKQHAENFRWFELPFWQFFLFWSAHVSALLLAPSQATAVDLKRYYRLPEGKVRVAQHGVESAFFGIAERRQPERFLLAVSTLHPHKNLDGLLRAFAAFRQRHADFRLVVCGLHGFSAGELHRLRDALGLHDAVDFPGWIPREDLYWLFSRAWAFVYPSLFEGFGLPVVEALAAGVPTACSAIEPLRSVAGEAALQFDPLNQEALLAAMFRIAEDDELRRTLSSAGPARVAQFSWKFTAQTTLEALEDAAKG